MSSLNRWWNNLIDQVADDPEYLAEAKSIDLAIEIKTFMNKAGISQAELAEKMDVSPPYVNQILQGHNNMTILTMFKISAALGININISFNENVPVPKPCEDKIVFFNDINTSNTLVKEEKNSESEEVVASTEIAEPQGLRVAIAD
jgi:transcriptional regulator with XRE-family HTH domain